MSNKGSLVRMTEDDASENMRNRMGLIESEGEEDGGAYEYSYVVPSAQLIGNGVEYIVSEHVNGSADAESETARDKASGLQETEGFLVWSGTLAEFAANPATTRFSHDIGSKNTKPSDYFFQVPLTAQAKDASEHEFTLSGIDLLYWSSDLPGHTILRTFGKEFEQIRGNKRTFGQDGALAFFYANKDSDKEVTIFESNECPDTDYFLDTFKNWSLEDIKDDIQAVKSKRRVSAKMCMVSADSPVVMVHNAHIESEIDKAKGMKDLDHVSRLESELITDETPHIDDKVSLKVDDVKLYFQAIEQDFATLKPSVKLNKITFQIEPAMITPAIVSSKNNYANNIESLWTSPEFYGKNLDPKTADYVTREKKYTVVAHVRYRYTAQ